jgi:hypothetical protein
MPSTSSAASSSSAELEIGFIKLGYENLAFPFLMLVVGIGKNISNVELLIINSLLS